MIWGNAKAGCSSMLRPAFVVRVASFRGSRDFRDPPRTPLPAPAHPGDSVLRRLGAVLVLGRHGTPDVGPDARKHFVARSSRNHDADGLVSNRALPHVVLHSRALPSETPAAQGCETGAMYPRHLGCHRAGFSKCLPGCALVAALRRPVPQRVVIRHESTRRSCQFATAGPLARSAPLRATKDRDALPSRSMLMSQPA
jgi:hypothetical protein